MYEKLSFQKWGLNIMTWGRIRTINQSNGKNERYSTKPVWFVMAKYVKANCQLVKSS